MLRGLKEEVKAGIIVVASLLILSGFIIVIGGSKIFEKYDRYYIKVMNAAGLETGTQVKLGGVRVGRILAIHAPERSGEPVTVELGIKKGIKLYKGTKAYITQTGFVGDIYLLLAIDNTTTEKLQEGEVIPSEEKIQFDVLMSKLNGLSQSLDNLIRDFNKLFSQKNIDGIEDLIGNTNNAIVSGSSNFEKVASSLKETTEKLENVLVEIEDIVRDNKADISELIKKARVDIEKAELMIESIKNTASSVEKTSKSVDKAVSHQSKNFENLIHTMTKTTEELQELLNEIKHRPWSIMYRENKEE